jgi:hypothetical protein
MAGLRTEFTFTLPKGYLAPDGVLHRDGVMRLATARDEIEPLRDRSIDGPDDPYLTILVLARVITRLGALPAVGVGEIEGLFASDLAFLQDLYGIVNFGDQRDVAALQASVLPAEDDGDVDPFEAALSDSSITRDGIDESDDFALVELADDPLGLYDPAPPATGDPTGGPEAGESVPAARGSRRRGRIEEVSHSGSG